MVVRVFASVLPVRGGLEGSSTSWAEPFSPTSSSPQGVDDAHQDHRTDAELAANTFRDNVILEYEIPKYDGDLGNPNVFVPLARSVVDRKISRRFLKRSPVSVTVTGSRLRHSGPS